MTPRQQALAVLVALFVGAGVLIGVELANGAVDAGALAVADPCGERAGYPGEGLDAVLQRIVLDGLDGAACELDTTREELVLSLGESAAPGDVPWDDETIEQALRAGLLAAIDDAEERGSLNAVAAFLLRELVERGPVQWLVDGGQAIGGLFD